MSMLRRLGASEGEILVAQTNNANCLYDLGRKDEAVAIERVVYSRKKKLWGETRRSTLVSGNNLVCSLNRMGQYAEAKTLARKLVSQCRRARGPEDGLTLSLRQAYAETLYKTPTASRADVLQAVTILEDVAKTLRRVFGTHHPLTLDALADLERARMKREDVAA